MKAIWIAGATGLVGRALRAELPGAIALVRRSQPGAMTVDFQDELGLPVRVPQHGETVEL